MNFMKKRYFSSSEIERIILMAWADTVSFETITREYDLSYDEIREFMRIHQSPKTYIRWRKRVQKRSKHSGKHEALTQITSRRLKLAV
jgi:uncharacterized protein (TIGR03643 family)